MYVVFEGIDGSGKSTQIELVKQRLIMEFRKLGFDLENEIGLEVIAEAELSETTLDGDYVEMALRFALQRYLLHSQIPNHWFKDTNPEIILSDRSYYSSYAYQGWASDWLKRWIANLNEQIIHKPTMLFFFDNGDGDDELIHNAYQEYFEVLPMSTIYVDTKNHTVAETTEYIVNKILEYWVKRFEVFE